MDEAAGRRILKGRFEAAGIPIRESFPLDEEGVRIELDGFDPASRIGYEYLTTAAGDREDLSSEEIATLERWNQEGRTHILLVDELDGLDEAGLEAVGDLFLAELRRRHPAG